MSGIGRLRPLERMQYYCANHRTTACRATRRELRAPEAGRSMAPQYKVIAVNVLTIYDACK